MSRRVSPGGGVVAGRDDQDVFALDLVEATAADLDLGEQRPGVHEVEGQAVRGAGVPAVDGDPAREPAHDERGRGRDPDASRPTMPTANPAIPLRATSA